MIRNIIFDIGRVLAVYDWETYLKSYGFEPKKEAAIANAMFAGPVWAELDRGAWPVDRLLKEFTARAPQYRDSILEVFDKAEGCIRKLEYAKPWIASLKEQEYRVYYLSNYSKLMVDKTLSALDFLPLMDGGLFSYEVKQVKPEPEIYRSFLSRYPQVLPEESVFLDDRPENIRAAAAFGIEGILFQSWEQAANELEALLKTRNHSF